MKPSPFRPIGASGPYPRWLVSLRRLPRAGVYFIRDARSKELLYVGMSAGRLYGTLTRHFQTWGQDRTGCHYRARYNRAEVEVSVQITLPRNAHRVEEANILKLEPRDNIKIPKPPF